VPLVALLVPLVEPDLLLDLNCCFQALEQSRWSNSQVVSLIPWEVIATEVKQSRLLDRLFEGGFCNKHFLCCRYRSSL
jgi:hypothetical protein